MKRTLTALLFIALLVHAADDPKQPATPTPAPAHTLAKPVISDRARADFMSTVAGAVIASSNYTSMFKRWEAELSQRIQDINDAQQQRQQALAAIRAECQRTPGWQLDEQAAANNAIQCVQPPATPAPTIPAPAPTADSKK